MFEILYSQINEQAVLGALLIDNSKIEKISFLSVSDFYDLRNKKVFAAIKHLIDNNPINEKPADFITVAEYLINSGSLKREEIAGYTIELASNTPSSENIVRYAKSVKEYSLKRQAAALSNDLIKKVYDNSENIKNTLSATENSLLNIIENSDNTQNGVSSIKYMISGVIEEIQERYNDKKDITGLNTGFLDLNRFTLGLQKGDLIVIAGRPSMGKTTFAMNVAEKAAQSGAKVLFFSLEMSDKQLTYRIISSLGSVSLSNLQTGKLNDLDFDNIGRATDTIQEIELDIDDKNHSLIDIQRQSRRISRIKGLDLIVIDYLQLMESGDDTDNRNLQLGIITRNLKRLAKELSVPIILLSQLNRDLGKRADKRPILTDLRDSGSIEQDADLVLMLHRPEYYDKDNDSLKGLAECIIAKNRNGETGLFNLIFQGEFCRFRSAA